MRFGSAARRDPKVLDLFEEAGRNVQHFTRVLRELVAEYPERADLAEELYCCEQEGDRIAHDIIHRLNGNAGHRRSKPFDASDGYRLATAIDDIVDYAEQTGDEFGLYHVEAPMDQAAQMAEVLVACGAQIALALGALRNGSDLRPCLVEIHRLENEGDRISREALAALFQKGIDPIVVIRWKDIFEALEASIDACETVAHVLEGITLKRQH
jgi:uncharacterized protein